jgi:ribosome production factor 1
MDIKNKIKRNEVYHKNKTEKAQEKFKKRLALKKQESLDPQLKESRLQQNIPATLENTREKDETIVGEDPEVFEEEEMDEFANYFNGTSPKILVTTSKRASANCYEFAHEFVSLFPDAQFVKRGPLFEIKKMVQVAIKREFTDLIIINEDKKTPSTFYIFSSSFYRCINGYSFTRGSYSPF